MNLALLVDCVSPGLAWEMRKRMEQAKDYWADVPQIDIREAMRLAMAELEKPPRVPVICISEWEATFRGMTLPLPSLEEQAAKRCYPYYVTFEPRKK